MVNSSKCMIDEHSQLVININKLNEYVYSDESNKDDKVEFANKCLQLSAMKKYEEALCARLENAGIVFENGEYFEHVAAIKVNNPEPTTAEDSGNNGVENEQ